MDQPRNPLTHLALAFLNPDKEYFHQVLKEGVKETAGVFLQNLGDRLCASAQQDPNERKEKSKQ